VPDASPTHRFGGGAGNGRSRPARARHGKVSRCREESPGRKTRPLLRGHIVRPTPASDDLKRCTKCGEDKPRVEFSRDRSRKDGRLSRCKACVRRWQQDNAEHLADYHRRWQRASPRVICFPHRRAAMPLVQIEPPLIYKAGRTPSQSGTNRSEMRSRNRTGAHSDASEASISYATRMQRKPGLRCTLGHAGPDRLISGARRVVCTVVYPQTSGPALRQAQLFSVGSASRASRTRSTPSRSPGRSPRRGHAPRIVGSTTAGKGKAQGASGGGCAPPGAARDYSQSEPPRQRTPASHTTVGTTDRTCPE
jgi:hypothetical protein